jgi:hypothetical protein
LWCLPESISMDDSNVDLVEIRLDASCEGGDAYPLDGLVIIGRFGEIVIPTAKLVFDAQM